MAFLNHLTNFVQIYFLNVLLVFIMYSLKNKIELKNYEKYKRFICVVSSSSLPVPS